MSLPSALESRVFYQAAQQRLQDARLLMGGNRTTAAVYMAGYSVECILKALILELCPARQRAGVAASFRGSKAHDFTWLRAEYARRGGPQLPRRIAKQFILVHAWSTNLRYNPRMLGERDALEFMDAAVEILKWADRRL